MNTITSPKVNPNICSVNKYYVKIVEDDSIGDRQKNTVIKFTKLPDFDTDTQCQPRLRRFMSVGEPEFSSSRSMVSGFAPSSYDMMTRASNRKIINITEDEDDYNRKLVTRRVSSRKPTMYEEKQKSRRSVSKLNESSKCSYDTTPSAKSVFVNKVHHKETSKIDRNNCIVNSQSQADKKRLTIQNNKNTMISKTKTNVESIAGSLKEISYLKKSVKSNYNKNLSQKRVVKDDPKKSNFVQKKVMEKSKQVSFIKLQIKEEYKKENSNTVTDETEIDRHLISEDAVTETDPAPEKIDQSTETVINKWEEDKSCLYDSLDIPNVSLTKEKCDVQKEQRLEIVNRSLPNLKIPTVVVQPQDEKRNVNDPLIYKSPSYIIGRATVTYTTHRKIDFHVMSSNDDSSPNFRSSPVVYPYSLVSVLKQELCSETPKEEPKANSIFRVENEKIKEKIFDDSYLLSSNKLVKPSDIISTIKINDSMLQNDFICVQFQRELNFIDSFFDSLQYLENCFFTEKCLDNCSSELWADNSTLKQKNYDYNRMLSKLETNETVAGKETMASKSLYLLNLLIRDEQRRAKNLLLVLKMREDALKDFTKSQIIWLENKKKQENTDISTLKKKQRGALLKLQHECGEMQRMRKALLTLSEKRKAALMKTKKSIEVKLTSNVNVEQIILEKKKNKRLSTDRHVAPVKCFDLSSSGCDDSCNFTIRPERAIHPKELCSVSRNDIITLKTVNSVEKSIQTGDSILETLESFDANDTAEKNVVVDGGYLNILFQSHALPQIFSSGKQYEVNEEALRNIVNSSNQKNNKLGESDVFDKFMEQVRNHDTECSSSPSTARSLVDEFDQYYKDLAEEDNFLGASSDQSCGKDFEPVDQIKQIAEHAGEDILESLEQTTNTVINREEQFECNIQSESFKPGLDTSGGQTGPLTIPVGASHVIELNDSTCWIPLHLAQLESSSNNYADSNECVLTTNVQSVTCSVHEAEELRRQQLAIEREIKALEQQQCQLLVVREIPDKPPPPYTPPTEIKTVRQPRLFLLDEKSKENVKSRITGEGVLANQSDAFDLFLDDYCTEILKRQRLEMSDKPWDSCNLQPQKQELSPEKLVNKACDDLKDIIAGISPLNVTGVGRERRSDHIDDILFAEWRRCEPEWTALHSDEATVKNQIFENIFQRILSDTIVEYKKTLHKKPLNR